MVCIVSIQQAGESAHRYARGMPEVRFVRPEVRYVRSVRFERSRSSGWSGKVWEIWVVWVV